MRLAGADVVCVKLRNLVQAAWTPQSRPLILLAPIPLQTGRHGRRMRTVLRAAQFAAGVAWDDFCWHSGRAWPRRSQPSCGLAGPSLHFTQEDDTTPCSTTETCFGCTQIVWKSLASPVSLEAIGWRTASDFCVGDEPCDGGGERGPAEW